MAANQIAELNQGGVKVSEAWFGDKNGALALLKFPTTLRDFFLHLSDKADLPDSPPPGAIWGPFVRGWKEDDYYLIAKTIPDITAVRPGMVATRMLAIPLADAEHWKSLGTLFNLLEDSDRGYVPEQNVALDGEFITPPVASSVLACVAHNLIHQTKPVAIVGQDGFEKLIAALWLKLPPELRRTFGFGFSFTPTDLGVSRANVVAVPASCEARWRGYEVMCNTTWDKSLNVSTAAFLSDAGAQGFLVFLHEVGLVFHSFADYGRYARLWEDWQGRSISDPQVSYALLRSFGTLIPNPNQAVAQKEEALRIAAEHLRNSAAEGILAQRSVKASSFPDTATVLGRAISDWIRSRFLSAPARQGGDLARVILAIQSSQSTEWQTWLRDGLKQALKSIGEPVALTLWTICEDEGVFIEVAPEIPDDAITERTLIATFPATVPTHLYRSLETWCSERGWLSLLATSALAHLGFPKAVALILNQGRHSAKSSAIEILCASAKAAELWELAFVHDDATLQKCAVTAALAHPDLWLSPAGDLIRWVSLLESAATRQPDFLKKTAVDAVTARLFEAWEHGAPITTGVLAALEKVHHLEFTGYAKRDQLWSMVPPRYLHIAQANTLQAWLKDFYSNLPPKPKLEKELVTILFEPRYAQVTFPQNSPSLGQGGLLLVEAWGAEKDCEAWVHAIAASSTRLSQDIARRAGEFVSKKRWLAVARLAKYYDEDRHRHDLNPLWTACYESLGTLEKFMFDIFRGFPKVTTGAQSSIHANSMIDAVFFTALSEEFSAVKTHLSGCREHTENGTIYEIGRFEIDGGDCTVAVVQTGMGNVLSASATERALTLFKPAFAFFVGIAGGLRDDLKIGDVVAADKIYGYESGKAASKFKPRPEATTVSHEAFQRANAVLRDKTWQKRITPPPVALPKALVKPIAAGEKVMASKRSEEFKRLTETYSDAHAVAMEEHGFCVAVKTHPHVCFAVVRGISDLIVKKEEADSAGSHEVAAKNAAAFAFEMLAGLIKARE